MLVTNRKKMARKIVGILSISMLFVFSSFISDEVKSITWEDLSYVDYKYRPDLINGNYYLKPFFDTEVKKLHGKQVKITGYIIPIDLNGDRYYLSAQPNSSCYFCGQADKHSVLVLKLKNLPVVYKMDDYLTFEGTLYTHSDQESLPYSLENAILAESDK